MKSIKHHGNMRNWQKVRDSMREILFKPKRNDNGEWVEGYIFDDGNVNPEHYFVGTLCISRYKGKADDEWNIDGECIYEVQPDTICQYTGLTDKNGHKICENDIVKKHFYTDYDAYANSEEYTGVAKFTEYAWVIEVKNNNHVCTIPIIESIAYSKDIEHFEVIGNIFDNAELLERKE